ncbi:MAG TPA: retroviral-like aspartic protease family protein [Acetobacteraceae bacterium]|nr:retroviral-like aspartic protease family protein [Acetobacteraceae bacterium]
MLPITYRLRRALAGFALPLLLIQASCPPDAACNLEQVAQVPLELKNHVFVLPATVNGHAIEMLLDTGAQKSLLGEAAVQRLNLVRDARSYTSLMGLSGTSATPDARIDSMSIGAVALSVGRLSVNSFGGNQPFDGILGLDILRQYDLDIDGPKRMLTLYRVRRCEPAAPPWDEPAVPVAGFSTRTGWLKLPFKLDGIEGTGFLDTGASNTMIAPHMAQRLGLTNQVLANDRMIKLHVIAGDDTPSHVHWFDTIQIGPVVARHPYAYVLAEPPPPLGGDPNFGDGVIGLDLLGGQRIWISIGTGRLYLARNGGG